MICMNSMFEWCFSWSTSQCLWLFCGIYCCDECYRNVRYNRIVERVERLEQNARPW